MIAVIGDLRKRLSDPVDMFEAFLEKRGWNWRQLACGELSMTFEEIQYGLICSDRVLWAAAHLIEPDTGTHGSLLQASNFIEAIEQREGLMVACLKEIACKHGYIDKAAALRQVVRCKNNDYGTYLQNFVV